MIANKDAKQNEKNVEKKDDVIKNVDVNKELQQQICIRISILEKIKPQYINLFICMLYFGIDKAIIYVFINALQYILYDSSSENQNEKNKKPEMTKRIKLLKSLGTTRNQLGFKYNRFPEIYYSVEDVIKSATTLDRKTFFQILNCICQQKHIFDLFTNYDSVDPTLYELSSFFEHSCRHNVVLHINDRGQVVGHAIRPIDAKENLHVEYFQVVSLSPIEIDNFLLEHYGFTCKCDYCISIYHQSKKLNDYNLYDNSRSFYCNKCGDDKSRGVVYIFHKKTHEYNESLDTITYACQGKYLVLKCTSCLYEFNQKESEYFLNEEKQMVKDFFIDVQKTQNELELRYNDSQCSHFYEFYRLIRCKEIYYDDKTIDKYLKLRDKSIVSYSHYVYTRIVLFFFTINWKNIELIHMNSWLEDLKCIYTSANPIARFDKSKFKIYQTITNVFTGYSLCIRSFHYLRLTYVISKACFGDEFNTTINLRERLVKKLFLYFYIFKLMFIILQNEAKTYIETNFVVLPDRKTLVVAKNLTPEVLKTCKNVNFNLEVDKIQDQFDSYSEQYRNYCKNVVDYAQGIIFFINMSIYNLFFYRKSKRDYNKKA